MSKKLVNIVTYILTLLLCVFLIWLSVKDVKQEHIDKIKFAISKAKYILLLPIVIMGFISHWSRAMRWRYLMQPMGLHPGITNTFFAVLIGYLANLAFPRLGEVLKCTILSKYEKVPADKLVGTIIAERAFDLLCLIILFFITFFVQIDLAKEFTMSLFSKYNATNQEKSNTLWYILIGLIFVVTLLFLYRKKITQSAPFIKVKSIMKNIVLGIMSFQKMKNKKAFIFHTLLIWTMYMGMIMLGFYSIQETSMLTYKTGFSVLSFGSVGMIVTPGGLGAYTLLVEEIVSLYGIEKAISLAISWIIWLVPTIIIISGGAVSLFLLPIYNRKKNVQ